MASFSDQEVNEDWDNPKCTREEPEKRVFKSYIDYLAAPNPRYVHSHTMSEEKLGLVPRAALRAKASKRIKRLALPRSLPSSQHTWEDGNSINPATLKFRITEHLNELAVPSPRLLGACLKEYSHILTESQREILEQRMKEGEKLSRRIHDKYYIPEEHKELDWKSSRASLRSKTSRALRGSTKSAKEVEWDHQRRIEILARPVIHRRPVVLGRGKKTPLRKLMRRIKHLSQPSPRDEGAHRAKEWKFTPEMKNYKASERLQAISKPIMRPNIHVNLEPKVSEGAKNSQASERVKILALPKRKAQEPDTELRENPFSVSPLALQAKCTPRLKDLAQPVQRGAKK